MPGWTGKPLREMIELRLEYRAALDACQRGQRAVRRRRERQRAPSRRQVPYGLISVLVTNTAQQHINARNPFG